jgi:hypothetical protein
MRNLARVEFTKAAENESILTKVSCRLNQSYYAFHQG